MAERNESDSRLLASAVLHATENLRAALVEANEAMERVRSLAHEALSEEWGVEVWERENQEAREALRRAVQNVRRATGDAR